MSKRLKMPTTINDYTSFVEENKGLKIEKGTDVYEQNDLKAVSDYVFALEANEIMADVEEEIDVPDYDEEGNPIIIEYEDTETIIDYDEEGEVIGSHDITVIKHKQQTHKLTVIVHKPIINPNYEQEQAEKERQRLDALTLTPSDVERALYYSDLKMDFDDLKALISKEAQQIDLKGLAIEFRANNFYRGAVDKNGNRIIDMVGTLLGYTSQDMDYLFENKQLPIKEISNENSANTNI